ncbi:predicted esterase of the alpha-beta hydrolase superfamily [Anaerolinea thermolimosa]|uniref:patatin-like phospholipase family protein n=1 Tax=Anaerolinea thermolimosa TaxID=229919 RepID=UPI000782CBBC|nr:patatin-like phospholipase family protein [Anaerolinea thermolimosa]GAP06667.1 predicted esterase of the alpha-beta hydrolase superfamily [Anaerolinea thermolimosa]
MTIEVSLALGGGGVRGIAHLGVIDFLESQGVCIKAVAGTSIGSLMGALYAAGKKPSELIALIHHFNLNDLYRRRPEDGPAIFGHAGLIDVLSDVLGDCDFSQLKIPFACTAVDLNTAKEVYLTSGKVIEAILASSAFPGMLPPRPWNDFLLVDGGILDPVPVKLARLLAPGLPVIAVTLQPPPEEWGQLPEADLIDTAPLPIPHRLLQGFSRLRIGQAVKIFTRSMDINSRMVAELRLLIDRPDVNIRPDVIRFGLFEQVDPDILADLGRQAASEKFTEIVNAASLAGKIRRFFRQIAPMEEPAVLFRNDPEHESSRRREPE